MASSCFIQTPKIRTRELTVRPAVYVRFGSKADICNAKWHVRFTPKSGDVAGSGVSGARRDGRSPRRPCLPARTSRESGADRIYAGRTGFRTCLAGCVSLMLAAFVFVRLADWLHGPCTIAYVL